MVVLCVVLLVVTFGVLASFIGYSRRYWANVRRDFVIATSALKRVEALSSSWSAERTERRRCLENAQRSLRAARSAAAKNAHYKLVRTYLNDSLWWLATLLISHEPEYLQDLFGENRKLVRHLFWSWNGSMDWEGVPPNREQYVVRTLRLALYREIKALSKGKVVQQSVLDAATQCLSRRDFPGETANARLDSERGCVAEMLAQLRSLRESGGKPPPP